MNPLTLLGTYASAYPKAVQTMTFIILSILFLLMVFGSGYWIGKMKADARAERAISEERIASLESVTEAYALLLTLDKKHASDTAKLEEGLTRLDRSITRSVNAILKDNPDLARWYRDPINDVQRTVMYGDITERMRDTQSSAMPVGSDNAATGHRVAHPVR